ncbi:benzyl alcohol dehydrogenase [Pseudomonas putida TRO1]|nr:benzyl alcohol dehydrogenase [Pseudomonas putida TRO1]
MAAVVAGCTKIIVVDVKENRLKLADELGATHVINAASSDPVEKIKEICAGGVPYVLETSGLPSVLQQAILSSAIGGEIGIVGAPPMGATIPVDINFLLFNRKLRGIVEGQSISDIFIPRLVELYRQGKFPFDKLLKFYSFDEINQAAEDSENGITLKPVLRIS